MQDDIKYLSVSELNRIIKIKFDNSSFFNKVFIKGEISNFKIQMPSGHCYFTVKDEGSRISAVMFKSIASKINQNFKDGDLVNIVGRISVYEASGSYQIYIESMELNGSGNLYKKFLELKEKLFKEGYFDENHKRKIVKYPSRIGVVTASTGAAIRDIITTIKRRYPLCEIILFPSLVQGISAKEDIVKKIEMANNYKDHIDTLIVGRGGGSIEDLWAYNEEIVAKAIYNSKIPVISAVGHEIDFTIADYVADKRAATPTGAAELAVPNIVDILQLIDSYAERSINIVNSKIKEYKTLLNKISNSSILINPINIYNIKLQKLKIQKINLQKRYNEIITEKKVWLFKQKNNYLIQNPHLLIEKYNNILLNNINKLELLNPLNSLKRGYAIIKKDDKCIENIKKINKNDNINIYVENGIIDATVTSVKEV